MIRETITIALLMFTSSAFGQICTPECDPTKGPTYYHIENLGDFETKQAVVETWFRATGSPFAVHCSDGPAHQVFWGPSGHCSQPVPYDLTQFVRTRECVAAVTPDRDGFTPMVDVFRGIPDTPAAADTSFQREIQQTSILQEGDRIKAVRPGGAEVVFEQIGGVWFPRNGTDRLMKWPNGSLSYDVAEDGSVEKYSPDGTLLSSTDKDGNVTWYEFNARKLEVRRVTNGLVTTTEWHPTFKLPLRVAEPGGKITTFAYGAPDYPRIELRGRLITTSVQKTDDPTGELAFDAPKVGGLSITTAIAYNTGGQVTSLITEQGMMKFDYGVPEEVGVSVLTSAMWSSTSYKLKPSPRGPDKGFCGSAETEIYVPDSVGGNLRISWTGPCANHDACYGRCGASKKTCDLELRDDMLAQCEAANFPPDPAGGGNFHLEACKRWANVYHTAVDWMGAKPYRDAQKTCSPGRCAP